MTREPDFFKKLHLNLFQAKQIRIDLHFCYNWIYKNKLKFNLSQTPPNMAYMQHVQNSCCFSSLVFALKIANEVVAANEISTCIYVLLTHDVHSYYNIIKFAS